MVNQQLLVKYGHQLSRQCKQLSMRSSLKHRRHLQKQISAHNPIAALIVFPPNIRDQSLTDASSC